MARIFVSYARPTQPQARLVAETLRAGGHEVWIDDQLLAHRSFTDAIEEQLDAADAVIVLWSSHAASSEWVRAEASRARKAGKLLQVRVEPCTLPMPYDQIHCIDLTSWSGDYRAQSWRSLLASLAAISGDARARTPTAATRTGGQRAGAADRRGERRQVTALFCDLADSRALAARLDPEDMMQVLDAYQAACDDIIAQHGGSIAKYMGHGVLAYFGYPRGDEEEAANAVRAGLALRDAVARLDLPPGVVAKPRVGIATGLVVVSELIGRDATRETGIVGETHNLAAQLEAAASPGAVVVAEGTRRITDGLFAFRDLGGLVLAGYDSPTRAFEAVEATDLGSRSQARALSRATPLFGRERELAQMSEAWDLACEGEGQVVLVQGEAGIGKSGLVETFRRRAAETPSTQITFYCAPNYSETALHPVSDLFARAAGFEHADTADGRREKLRRLLERFGEAGRRSHAVLADLLGIPPDETSPREAVTPERRKAVTLDSLLALMDPLAEDRPALFIFEDLHWADPTTLELLDRVTRRAAERSWLILGAARPEFEARWSEHADLIHIQLGRLGRGDAERICLSLGAEALLSPEDMRQIIARSDGVPLFVEEMTKAAIESVESAPTGDGAPRPTIPDTLHDSLVARLDRLGAAKPVASLGATIGRRFGYELLAAVAPQPAAELRQALRELTKSGLVERSGAPPNSHYLFKHALIRDAAYESLLKRERETLHGRIAAALRDQFQETCVAEPALIAYHLTQSGAVAEAIPLWMEAGQQAASRAAHAEAVSHLQTALDLVRRLPSDASRTGLELQLLLGLAVSLAASRGYSVPEVGKLLAEARAICDALGNVAGLFAVLRGICNFSIIDGNRERAEETARSCLQIAEETGDVAHQIEADCPLGFILWMKGDFAAARFHLERAIRLYREHDGARLAFPTPQDPMVVCLCALPLVLDGLGDVAGAERASADLVAHARSLGRSFDLAFALTWHALRDVLNRNYASALPYSQEALRICQDNFYDTYTALASITNAACAGQLGDTAAAVAFVMRTLKDIERLGILHLLGLVYGELAALHDLAGDSASALSAIDEAITRSVVSGDDMLLSYLHLRRGDILSKLPAAAPGSADSSFREAVAVAEAQGAPSFAAKARARLMACARQA